MKQKFLSPFGVPGNHIGDLVEPYIGYWPSSSIRSPKLNNNSTLQGLLESPVGSSVGPTTYEDHIASQILNQFPEIGRILDNQ